MTDRIRHTVVHHDTAIASHLLSARPDDRVVAAQVPPDIRNRHELGQEILAGLAKRHDVSGVGRHARVDWEVLPAWFDAHGIEHLVVLGAEMLPADLFGDLASLAEATGAVVWTVAWQPAGDAHMEAIARVPHLPASLDEVLAVVPDTDNPTGPTATAPYPAVPGDTYLTFLAACRDHLPAGDFAVVRARYVTAASEVRTWIDAASDLDEDAVHAQLRRMLQPCVSYHETITVLRAAQAMAHVAGWAVQVDPMRLAATAETAPAATVADPRTWLLLRAYRDPYRPAACALAAIDFSVDDIRALRIGDISDDGQTANRPGEPPQRLPDGAEVFLRAQVALRRRQGADDTGALFADDGTVLSERTIVDAVRAPALELGINLISGAFQRRRVDGRSWAHRWGISVQDVR